MDIVIGDTKGFVHCIDRQSGKERWKSAIAKETCTAYASIGRDGKIYAGSVEGKIIALSGKNGEKLWETPLGSSCALAPAEGEHNTIYTSTSDGRIYALDSTTGKVKWRIAVDGSSNDPIVTGKNDMIISVLHKGTGMGTIAAFNGRTGKVQWQYEPGNSLYGSKPAVGADNTVVFNSRYFLYALDGTTGKEKWKFSLDDIVGTAPLIDEKGSITLGLSSIRGRHTLLSLGADGKKKWELELENHMSALSPPVCDKTGNFLIGCNYGLTCVRPPVIADEVLPSAANEGDKPCVEEVDNHLIIDDVKLAIRQMNKIMPSISHVQLHKGDSLPVSRMEIGDSLRQAHTCPAWLSGNACWSMPQVL